MNIKTKKKSNNTRKNSKLNNIKQNIKKNVKCNSIESQLSTFSADKILEELGAGSYGIAFKGCFDKDCEKALSVKYINISKGYKSDSDSDYSDINNPSNIEVRVGKDLAKLVYEKKTPHINITITSLVCNFDEIKSLKTFNQEKASTWIKETEEKINSEKIYPQINITFNELASLDLQKYVLENDLDDTDHMIIFFQFCYTLTCIQYNYSNFKHNDIKPNNLLVKLIDNYELRSKSEFIQYTIFGKNFYIPKTKYIVKLHDFDFVYSDKYANKKITMSEKLKEKGYSNETNCLYDIHSYINFYYHKLNSKLSPEFKEVLINLVPTDNDIKNIKYSNNERTVENTNDKSLENTLLGRYTNYTNNYKLSLKNPVNGSYNYIPKKMRSCADLLIQEDSIFEDFKKNTPNETIGDILETYDSKIPYIDPKKQKDRPDMFNINLHS